MNERFIRMPVPQEKPADMDRSTWCKIKKRGWYCPRYSNQIKKIPAQKKDRPGRERTICFNGEDYLTEAIEDLGSFFSWTFSQVLKKYRLSWEYVSKRNPGLEREDLVHEGIVRALELRSDPRGKENWKFFAYVAQTAQWHYLRSLRKHSSSQVEEITDEYCA